MSEVSQLIAFDTRKLVQELKVKVIKNLLMC